MIMPTVYPSTENNCWPCLSVCWNIYCKVSNRKSIASLNCRWGPHKALWPVLLAGGFCCDPRWKGAYQVTKQRGWTCGLRCSASACCRCSLLARHSKSFTTVVHCQFPVNYEIAVPISITLWSWELSGSGFATWNYPWPWGCSFPRLLHWPV